MKSRLERNLKSRELMNLVRIKEFLFKVIIQPPATENLRIKKISLYIKLMPYGGSYKILFYM